MKLAGFEAGDGHPFFLIAGPCVIETEEMAMETASVLQSLAIQLDIPFIYKSSYDKANRTSASSPRGPGIDKGLEILGRIRRELGVPVLTDVHSVEEVSKAAAVVDMLQTPAFLCRQTDLIQAAAASGKPVNIKKGQFLSPTEMVFVAEKARVIEGARVTVCERGSSFGYNNLVVDMRSLAQLRKTQCPVVFDATHSVQLPGGAGGKSGGQREFVPVLARAAVAVGVDGLFMETHPEPEHAWSDGANAWPLGEMETLLRSLKRLDTAVKRDFISAC